MRVGISRPVSGHVFRVERKRGAAWYAKYRLPDGRQVQRKLGPAWTRRGRPAAGYFTKALAQEWLDTTPAEARRGELAGMVQTGTTFADAEWLVYVEQQWACKPRTVVDYSNMVRVLNGWFGDRRLEPAPRDPSTRQSDPVDLSAHPPSLPAVQSLAIPPQFPRPPTTHSPTYPIPDPDPSAA